MKPITYLSDWAAPYYGVARFDLATSGVPEVLTAVPGFVAARPGETPWSDMDGLEALDVARARVGALYGVPAGRVTLTFGGTEGLFLTALALARRDRPVVVESPTYEPLHRNFEALGCEIRFLERPRAGGYRLEAVLDRAAELARGATGLVVTNPNNPTGVHEDREVLARLARAIAPAWLVVNESYLPLVPGAVTALGTAENVCIINSLTKAYGLGIPRFAWVVAPEPLSRSLHDAVFYLHGRYSGTVAALALPLIDQLPERLAQATAHLRGRHDAVDRALAATKRVRWLRPAGLVTVGLVTIEGVTDDLAFGRALLEERAVITAPGSFFRAPGMLRLSLGAAPDRFEEGLSRFLEFAEGYRE